MRFVVAALAGAVGLMALQAVPARAQSPYSYPWCAYYAPAESGLSSCYFATYELCQASISGVGGYCALNPAYRGPDRGPAPAPGPTHRRRHHRSS